MKLFKFDNRSLWSTVEEACLVCSLGHNVVYCNVLYFGDSERVHSESGRLSSSNIYCSGCDK